MKNENGFNRKGRVDDKKFVFNFAKKYCQRCTFNNYGLGMYQIIGSINMKRVEKHALFLTRIAKRGIVFCDIRYCNWE